VTPDDLARRINAVDLPKVVLYVTGGGTEVFPILLAGGGGSATLIAGRIPYDPNDFRAALGHDPGRMVGEGAARGLAMAAFRHGLSIRGEIPADSVIGIGATSKLSRGPGEREGRSHEIHAACQSSWQTDVRSVLLPPGGDRRWEERINALVILNLIAAYKGDEVGLTLEFEGRTVPADAISERQDSWIECNCRDLQDILVGRRRWAIVELPLGSRPGGVDASDADRPRLILPGSFRPVHAGHIRMAEIASGLMGLPCSFELSLCHPEKPPLDYLAIASRLRGFADVRGWIYLTDAPTYVEKARLFPGATFVVGHDAALRILDPRFYGGPEGRDAILAELESLGTRFLIFGRLDDRREFRQISAGAFDHPAVARFLGRNTRTVPEELFRVDVSSTEIRIRDGLDLP